MSSTKASLALAIISVLLIYGTPSVVIAAPAASHVPMIRHGTAESTNWSGFAVTGAQGSVSDVKGSWVVPAIVGTCPSTDQYSSHWVGIDGFNSNSVEQTGTDSDCQSGHATYYAWYEFYPKPSHLISGMTVNPGDKITAEVEYRAGRFVATITDVTTGQTFTTSAKVNAQRSSAEWISEAPYSGGILPLANFGTIYWGTDNTGISSTNYATITGVTGPIGSFGSSVQSITMVTNRGAIKASPSGLSSDGTSFSIAWASSGP